MDPTEAEREARTSWFLDMRCELATILRVEMKELPAVFSGQHRHRKILKTNIDQDIFRAYPHASLADVHGWLHRYTSDIRYLKRLGRYAKHRHDLNGHNVEAICPRDRKSARQAVHDFYKTQERIQTPVKASSQLEGAHP